jgi:hypothetical protein
MKALNVSIFVSVLAIIAVMVSHTPLFNHSGDRAPTAAAATVSSLHAGTTQDAKPLYYLPSEYADAERNASAAGEPAPTF